MEKYLGGHERDYSRLAGGTALSAITKEPGEDPDHYIMQANPAPQSTGLGTRNLSPIVGTSPTP